MAKTEKAGAQRDRLRHYVEPGLGIYNCHDCGCQFAAQLLLGPTGEIPHFVAAANGGKSFVAYCVNCGGTMIEDIGPKPDRQTCQVRSIHCKSERNANG